MGSLDISSPSVVVFLVVWVCGSVLAVRECGNAGVFLAVWVCLCVMRCVGVRVCFGMCGGVLGFGSVQVCFVLCDYLIQRPGQIMHVPDPENFQN